MEFRQLKTFCTVADTLSFTKTAQQLFMAQSSVSAQIRALEEDLEVKLFDRIGRRVFLTAAGEKLVQYARRIETMTEEIKSEVSGNSYIRGTLTIRVPETLATIYMPEIVSMFHQENPGVKLIFINCSDRQLREELNSGRIDLAFLMTDTIHFSDINVKMLKTEEIVLVAGPTHSLAKQRKASLQEIGEQTILFPKTDWSYRRMFERSLDEQNVSPRTLEFSSINSIRRCVNRGVGLAVCPLVLVEKELVEGRLIQIACNQMDTSASVVMIWHAEKWCSPILKRFMEIAEMHITWYV